MPAVQRDIIITMNIAITPMGFDKKLCGQATAANEVKNREIQEGRKCIVMYGGWGPVEGGFISVKQKSADEGWRNIPQN